MSSRMSMTNFKHKPSGFTLIEVLVAVTILAVGVGGIIKALGQTASNLSYLQEMTFAHWVAQNVLIETELSGEKLELSTKKGSEELASIEWFWEVKVSEGNDTFSLPIELPGAKPLPLPQKIIEVSVKLSRDATTPLALIEKRIYQE